MKPINVFAVWTTVDEWGRTGSLIAVTETEDEANRHADGWGWYGGTGKVEERKAIKDGNKIYLLDNEIDYSVEIGKRLDLAKERMRKNALKKLTKEEKEILRLEGE